MIRKGYSLIEVLISAAIFAGVLIGAFTVYSTVSRAGSATNASRDVSYAGHSLVDSISEIARYATPTRGETGALGCVAGAGVGGNIGGSPISQFAANSCFKGLYYDGANKIGINILKNNTVGTSSYEVYEFSIVPYDKPSTFIKGGTTYNVYKPLLTRYIHHPNIGLNIYTLDPNNPATGDLLPNDVAILVPAGGHMVTYTESTPIGNPLVAITADKDLSLDIKDAQEVPAIFLEIDLSFASVNDMLSKSDSAEIYEFKTAVSNRSYSISFIE